MKINELSKMSTLNVNLENLTNEERDQLTSLITKAKTPIKKWEPKGGSWFVSPGGRVTYAETSRKFRLFGLEYPTKEQAQAASKAMRSFNRQLAWLAENDDGWEADWGNFGQNKFYLSYFHNHGLWDVRQSSATAVLNTVYMSEGNAKKLCKLLNSGVVEF